MRCILPGVPLLLLLLSVSFCGRGVREEAPGDDPVRALPPVPSVPSYVSDAAQAAEFLASHYWNAFFDTTCRWRCDTAHVLGIPAADAEAAFARYVTLLEEGTLRPFAKTELEHLFARAAACETADTAGNAFEFFVEMAAKYLYDPNSPVRDEDLYQPFVSALAASPLAGERQAAYAHDAAMCALNAVGTRAADFVFTDLSGRRRNLYAIPAERTLLFFTNPGCPACREIISVLKEDERVTALLRTGRLAVAAIYIDQEIDQWKAYAGDYPRAWISGYDQDFRIRTDRSYNVRAIPSLYLLGRDKTVLLKDVPMERILQHLVSP